MIIRKTYLLAMLAGLILSACKGAGFKGNNGGRGGAQPSPVPVPTSADGNPLPGSSPAPGSGGGLKVTDGSLCVDGPVDLNVMLLMDTTGSMNNEADEVRAALPPLLSSISSYKSALGDSIKTVRLGAIGYIDQARFTINPIEDLNLARSQIDAAMQGAGNWNDSSDRSEGGFWSFFTALDLMKQAAAANRSINVSFIITDAWSHDGAPCGADCSPSSRTFNVSLIESRYSDPAHAAVMIYDWSPSSRSADGSSNFSDGTTNRYGSPKGQWDFLRERFKQVKAAPNFSAGAHISDNPSISTTDVAAAIKNLSDQLKKCR